jgi:hypothetical protein
MKARGIDQILLQIDARTYIKIPPARPLFLCNFSDEGAFHDCSLASSRCPDPELKTSPIFDQDEEISLDAELEAAVCYFNDAAYRIGEYVPSGGEVLRCEVAGFGCANGRRSRSRRRGRRSGR